jgi:hypothetical protein
VAVPAHVTSDLTSPSDGHKKRKKKKTYLFNMFRNPLTKRVAEFAKSRLLGAAADAKFVREHKIYSFGRGTQNCRR